MLYFQLYRVSLAAHRFSLVRVSGATLQSTGSGAWAQQLWCTGLAAPQHMESSQNRDRTHVPCIGRWIPNLQLPPIVFWTTTLLSFPLSQRPSFHLKRSSQGSLHGFVTLRSYLLASSLLKP